MTHPHEIAEVLMLLTNVWTGMFPGSREEFAAKLRFCGEFLDRFGLAPCWTRPSRPTR